MDTKDKILKARARLILDYPFYGALVMRLTMEENKDIETAIVTPRTIQYNPQWVDSLPLPKVVGMLAHEVMHIAMGHCWRQGDRDPKTFNEAADYAINYVLKQSGIELPDDVLIDSRFQDTSAEEIYGKIYCPSPPPQENQQGGDSETGDQKDSQGKGQGENPPNPQNPPDPGGCGTFAPGPDPEKKEEDEMDWKQAVAAAGKFAGKVPAGIQRMIQEVLYPPLPWTVLLRDFVEKSARNDYNWSRCSTRYAHLGVVLPSLISEEIPEVVIAVDTSGSITPDMLNHFASEASQVLEAFPTTVRVLYCDTEINKEEVFTKADMPLKMEPVGGGGTDFNPVFDHIRKEGLSPSCVIYFTDMYGSFPDREPETPTLWISTSKGEKAPWGQTIEFTM